MLVRVYDNESKSYFKSYVYGIIDIGWFEKVIVLTPTHLGNFFKMVDYVDKTVSGYPQKMNVNMISLVNHDDKWIKKEKEELLPLRKLIEEKGFTPEKLEYCFINQQFWDNPKELAAMYCGEKIPNIYNIDIEIPEKDKEWNYIESQNDIDELMKKSYGFHDTTISSINFQSGISQTINKNEKISRTFIYSDELKQIYITFFTLWSDSIELVFGSVIDMNLRTSFDLYFKEIFSASLFIKNEIIYFCTDYVGEEKMLPNDSTWISAFTLKWRFIK